ncbi:MAG TPA: amylo-alpha-1,6-glucosidase [Candidatus Angelobacter sp.]|nr:amylo-alpha-1,6-glucosidase [Candidatus Angelobacter sp.]
MSPAPGERLLRFVGDRVRFTLRDGEGRTRRKGWSARLRTNLGRAVLLRQEIIHAHAKGVPLAGASWCDLPMREDGEGGWSLELAVADVGFFKAKAYLLDEKGWQHWPDGADVGITVHPDAYRTGNTIYCAFPRLFGPTRNALSTQNPKLESQIEQIEDFGFAIIPPSGKLRDLVQCLPHIIDVLGCRILHVLPVHPTPTTFARFGRFGSPYAALDFMEVDPALVVFDKRTTGIDQFRELTYGTHLRGGRVIIDIVINHTGWGSKLQEEHPEWFLRKPDGEFASPGAWGVVWEDLVELNHINAVLWDELAEMFLTWCRRGVDGFRCDAGYKVPTPAWQYIIARVQQEFPETVFLLEGLGGPWETTEALLTEGGMQWAYSELFQNYSGHEVAWYLDYALRQSQRVGVYVHYSETHDNDRLAKKGRAWALLRNRLCALTSVSGGFGFTCGVEWLATEKILVHGSTGLAWNNPENLVPELSRLNQLLREHPCFFDGAKLTRLSGPDSPVYALLRESAEGKDAVLVLVNTDAEKEQSVNCRLAIGDWRFDLLGQAAPRFETSATGEAQIKLGPGAAFCLASTEKPAGLSGDAYRVARAQAAWATQALGREFAIDELGAGDWRKLAEVVARSPFRFLAAIRHLDVKAAQTDLLSAIDAAIQKDGFPQVVRWGLIDIRRMTPVPPRHWLLIEDTERFRAALEVRGEKGEVRATRRAESVVVGNGHIACFAPDEFIGDARLLLERYSERDRQVEATVCFLPAKPQLAVVSPEPTDLVLLTNGRGGMARLCVDLGRVNSKYDCALGANLHPTLPVDRHIFVKRIRVWVNADGFITPLDFQNLGLFDAGPPAVWNFVANAGDGQTVEIELRASMLAGRNTTLFEFSRPTEGRATGKQLPADADVRLTVRVDIEDRNFHWETKRNGGAEYHFATNTHPLSWETSQGEKDQRLLTSSRTGKLKGFAFTPAADRQLRVFADVGQYRAQVEWCENIPHPVEQSRGQTGSGDAYSPGWFELPLPKGSSVKLTLTAELDPAADSEWQLESPSANGNFEAQLLQAARAFVVRRGSGKSVIAGYPWFLDWGRDTFISARGLLAAGMVEDVKQILTIFARFEKDGTLPNTIFGNDASNRDTSDAPLWFGVVCEEVAARENPKSEIRNPKEARNSKSEKSSSASPSGSDFGNSDLFRTSDFGNRIYNTVVDESGRTICQVLQSIAENYIRGTPNGIRMDADSGLIWSPSHFTWMDTNFPAGTPREGYPVEIQALWIRLLRQLGRISEPADQKKWNDLAARALASVETLFWMEDKGWYADVLLSAKGTSAREAKASDALRNNCLFLVSLGLVTGERARRCVAAALQYLVVPGALRSLAPLPIKVPLPVYANGGGLLNDPMNPYWGRYEGDEDTRRKPAYHNGTAWTWTFAVFCEALARAWDFSPQSVAAARAYLGSMDRVMNRGCLGQIPEILDGDAPHQQRGCDAQAWGVTEALRVWKMLAD